MSSQVMKIGSIILSPSERFAIKSGPLRDHSLFKCQGAAKKCVCVCVGGHVNFHVASSGVAINFEFPAGGGGGHV